MNINWILRLKNKATLLSLIGILVVAIYQIVQLFGYEIPLDQKQVLDFCNTVITILCVTGIVVDPTTQGIGDSEQAMEYKEPRK